ncbi:MAG: hypothetical protein AAF548_14035 [Actinomycetota bacterium]
MGWFTQRNDHGVARWVVFVAGLLAVFGTLIGLVAFFGPDSFAGEAIDATGLARSWGARNAALAAAMGAAALVGRPEAFLVSFTGAAGREIGDLVNGIVEADGTWIVAVVVLAIDLAAIRHVLAARQRSSGMVAR